jgi:phosphoserine phosphatase RsbU/P
MSRQDLEAQLLELKRTNTAFETQQKLFATFMDMAQSPTEGGVLKNTLLKTLEVSVALSGAETGSLFLLNRQGVVTESILARPNAEPRMAQRLIGQVLEKGLAGWVRRHCQLGLINDTRIDERWLELADQPYQVRSVLAVPIMRANVLFGILTLQHSQAGQFNEDTARLMQNTAAQLALPLENARLFSRLNRFNQALKRAKKKIEHYSEALKIELEKGRRIQSDFLPESIPQPTGWEIDAWFNPAYQVGGDFYDAFHLPGDLIGLVIADVCDKGVGAALFMALTRSLIRIYSKAADESGLFATPGHGEPTDGVAAARQALQAVPETNDFIVRVHGKIGMFTTLFFGVLNPRTGLLAYINGGHPAPLMIGPAGIKRRLSPTGPAVGVLPQASFAVETACLEPGDILLGYTDGVIDTRSPLGDAFGLQRLVSIAQQATGNARQLLARLKSELLRHHADTPQFDDITIMVLRRWPDPSASGDGKKTS